MQIINSKSKKMKDKTMHLTGLYEIILLKSL